MDPVPRPPLDYCRSDRRPLRLAWVWVGLTLIGGFLFLLPRGGKAINDGDRGESAANLQQIGLAIFLYRHDHGGRAPTTLADLVADEQLDPRLLVCPDSGDVPATLPSDTPTTRQVAAALAAPGHVSYAYAGHTDWDEATTPADAILAYERTPQGWGRNVLFADGHVSCVPAARAARLIAAEAATTRPVSAATVP